MRTALRLLAVATFCLGAATTAASQTSQSTGLVYDYYAGYTCNGTQAQANGSTIACTVPTSGGSGYVNTTSSNAARTVTAATSLSQSGGGGSQFALARGYSSQNNNLYVTGTSDVGDKLVFHFQATRSYGFLGTNGGTMQSF